MKKHLNGATFRVDLSNYDPNGPDWSPLAETRWVGWRYVSREGKDVKIPTSVHGGNASVSDESTWGTRREARRLKGDGIGIVLGYIESENEYLCGIDLDSCLDDGERMTDKVARDIVRRFDTYAEVSPSGHGVHLLFTVSKNDILSFGLAGRRTIRKGSSGHDEIAFDIERRYYTYTGDVYGVKRHIRRVGRLDIKWLLSLSEAISAPEPSRRAGRDYTGSGYANRFLMSQYHKLGDDFDAAMHEIKKSGGRAGDWARRVTQRELERAWEQAMRFVDEDTTNKNGARHAVGRIASTITPTNPKFLFYPYILEEGTCIIASPGGTGKGLFVADLVARETTRNHWPMSDDRGRGRKVLWYEMEDPVKSVLVPRLQAAGADNDQVFIYEGSDDLSSLTRERVENENIGIVVLSPLLGYLDVENIGDIKQVYRGLEKLNEKVKDLPCTIIGLMHPNKKTDLPAVERILGSVGFPAYLRSVILLRPEDDDTVRMVHAKHNNSIRGADLIFTKHNTKGPKHRGQYVKIEWEEADENITITKAFDQVKGPTGNGNVVTAGEWLQSYLSDKQWHRRRDILAAGETRSHSRSAMIQAMKMNRELYDSKSGGWGKEKTGFWRLK